MKRSEINDHLSHAIDVIARAGVALPPFARWTPDEFADRATPAIIAAGLGWDLIDDGRGDPGRAGLIRLTLRNGSLTELAGGGGRVYAERLLILRDRHSTAMHTHLLKTGDLINRWGGTLTVRLCGSDAQGRIDRRKGITVECDGISRWVEAGGLIRLDPGESVALRPGDWRALRAEGGDCLMAEISTVADDHADDLYATPRRPALPIAEDAAPVHLLVRDYDLFIGRR
ncbi:MAG: D-lyxose/D-mannose family sugar isomerase [Paracoccus sp. (in: a-proteobacteria)]|nr:D-lyxose/D-mannose family sugar isomerase [Paracoccus sp. (in: a-proteobacteria)]